MAQSPELSDLPNEVLLGIFSFLPAEDLFYHVRLVCKRFMTLALDPTLWKKIEVGDEIPTGTLQIWLRSARSLKHFGARDRHDANVIAEELSRNCQNLESIKLEHCWGSISSTVIRGLPLCHVATRCHKLHTVNLARSSFESCKFFRVLSRDKRNKCLKACKYIGPVTAQQMKTLLACFREYDVDDTSTISNVHMDHSFKLTDVIREISGDYAGTDDAINEFWMMISNGPDHRNRL